MQRSGSTLSSLLRRFRFVLVAFILGLCFLLSYTRHRSQSTWLHASGSTAPIPVIIFSHDRAENLRTTIDSVLGNLPYPPAQHPIFVSQDGDDKEVSNVIASYGSQVTHLHYHYNNMMRNIVLAPHFRIAAHHHTALTAVMDHVPGHEHWNRVIMLEDDMLISPDFFSYFRRMAPLFDSDRSLYCVSAWNDNGQKHHVNSATAVYRTDSFSGLGWMWSRDLWNELRDSWPPSYLGDWLQESAQRKGRTCIYPEISRVITFDREGINRGTLYDKFYKNIKLNHQNVTWDEIDVKYLRGDKYRDWLSERLIKAEKDPDLFETTTVIDRELEAARSGQDGSESLDKTAIFHDGADVYAEHLPERLVTFLDLEEVTDIMEACAMNWDHKFGVPRGSYEGVLSFRYHGVRVWVMPEDLELPL